MSSGNHWIGTNIIIHDTPQARAALTTANLGSTHYPSEDSPITTALDHLGITWATETTNQIILREPENNHEMPAKTYNTLRTLIITLAPHIAADGPGTTPAIEWADHDTHTYWRWAMIDATIHEQTGHITY